MALIAGPWLLWLAAFYHLMILVAGQHSGMKKCSHECRDSKMTQRIPLSHLAGYKLNEKSCEKHAIILKTKKNRTFCADPEEQWVQDVMKELDRQATAQTLHSGTFEKQIGAKKPNMGLGKAGITAAPSGIPESAAVSEPRATGHGGSPELPPSTQEAQTAVGTSPALPTAVPGSSGTTELPAESESPEFVNTATASSAAVPWPHSTAFQPEATEAPSIKMPSTDKSFTQIPTTSHPTPEKNFGPESHSLEVTTQSSGPENFQGVQETVPMVADTDTFQDWGPGSVGYVSSAGTPSREPVASGSWVPKAEEPIHATVEPQRLGVRITPVPDTQEATRRQAVGLLAFLGLLFCLGVAMFAYQSLQGCPRKMAGEMVEGLRYVPRSCGTNSYVLVPV
ncbi:fractalkine [Ochotona curzoniae]|uniref:fractalkine n=1 Tax=Ochotona curzoniae TaxID=130825 RepID=UPI001B353D44|nr:fractalkine [Ochotona curzoniae]